MSLLSFTHPIPVCGQLSSNHSHVHSIRRSYPYCSSTESSPHSSKHSPSATPLALRGTRIVFPSLKQISFELETETELILTLLVFALLIFALKHLVTSRFTLLDVCAQMHVVVCLRRSD